MNPITTISTTNLGHKTIPSFHETNINTLLVSDVHLGSELSGSEAALAVLKQYKFKRLVLLGDIFDDLNLKRLNKHDWDFLSYIRKLSNPKRGIDIIWIKGNHDAQLEDLSFILGIPILDEFQWDINGVKYIVIHGHQFDNFLIENWFISEIASRVYTMLQKLDRKTHRFSRYIKKISKSWLRLSKKVAEQALDYCEKKGADRILCGHTHQQFIQKRRNVLYVNIGCFTDKPATYAVIHEGQPLVELKDF
jgi:UDP-2,3-diacylglucosamine pyrophosphatase LpxH